MITPRFSLEQDDTHLIITICAPYTNVKDTEIHVFEDDFRFFSAPYYLRLTLPGKVSDTENSSAKYLTDDSKFIVRLEKITHGEVFQNLDMLTTFLQPKSEKRNTSKPLIEVICGSGEQNTEVEESLEEDEWFIEQTIDEEMPSEALLQQYKYGFANNHSGLGTKFEVELGEVAEIKNPDSVSPLERQNQRRDIEQERFSDDHYLADTMTNDEISQLIEFELDIQSLQKLTGTNKERLKNLCNQEFLLDKVWQKRLYLGLIDILYAYCYDWRVTEGSHCVETAWNISRISATLSWFEIFDTVKEVVRSSMRRSLSYPLHRNWELSIKVFQDTIQVLRSGQVGIVVCLLDILRIFGSKDPYYLLNQLYIQDYCVWAQKTSTSNMSTMISALEKAVSEITKADVDFDLCELEVAAQAAEDDEMYDEMSANIENVHL